MEFPFFSNNYWNHHPHRHWSGEENPHPHHWGRVESPPSMNRQTTRSPFPRRETPVMNNRQTRSQFPKAASKGVVDIPVRFIESVRSESMKATAAVKIQKVFRGLLVRKSMKKIAGIQKEVDEIEKRVSMKETILLMRRDAKERLKVNEMLMKLLLQLDSIRGVDSGVRVFRKLVIKKAIMLQERVDEIVSGDIDMVDTEETMQVVQEEEECGAEVVDRTVEIEGSDTKEDGHVESENHNAGHYEAPADHTSELQQQVADIEDKFDIASDIEDENSKDEEEDEMDIQQQGEKTTTQNEDSSVGVVEGGGEKKVEEENGSSGSSNRDLMERMIKGNEMLAGLVAELCERQESQSRLLSSLSQRVENLEKSYRSERSKRKKKRNNNINKC